MAGKEMGGEGEKGRRGKEMRGRWGWSGQGEAKPSEIHFDQILHTSN